MNSRTHPLGPSLEAIGGGSDPLPATQRSAFIMRPNPSLAPPPTNTALESTAFPLCAAVGHECNLARTPRARCAQWRVRQIRAGRPTMRRAAVQHAVQAARRCRRICNVIGMILVDAAVCRHPTEGVLYDSTASRKRFTCVCPEDRHIAIALTDVPWVNKNLLFVAGLSLDNARGSCWVYQS